MPLHVPLSSGYDATVHYLLPLGCAWRFKGQTLTRIHRNGWLSWMVLIRWWFADVSFGIFNEILNFQRNGYTENIWTIDFNSGLDKVIFLKKPQNIIWYMNIYIYIYIWCMRNMLLCFIDAFSKNFRGGVASLTLPRPLVQDMASDPEVTKRIQKSFLLHQSTSRLIQTDT